MKTITIEIKGPAGTGKSQIAERIHHMLNEANVKHFVHDSRSPDDHPVPLRLPVDTEVKINVEQC